MVTNRNSILSKELNDVLKLQQNVDGIISNVDNKIVPVIDVNPKHSRICNIVKKGSGINTTGTTIYTTPASGTQDFYLTCATLSFIKDATSTSLATYITITVDGVANQIVYLPTLTLTAQSDSITIPFPVPIKIDSGTNITVNCTTNVANISIGATIIGFTIDNPRA